MPDIVETIESAGRRWKVAIVRRSDGLLQVLLLKWTEEVVPDQGKVAGAWALHGRATAFFDDIVAARRAAQELLAANEGGS
jgi:hypothetical protein